MPSLGRGDGPSWELREDSQEGGHGEGGDGASPGNAGRRLLEGRRYGINLPTTFSTPP